MKDFDWRRLLREESGSLLMIVFGVLLTLTPDVASALIAAVLGWVLIALGVGMILRGIAREWNWVYMIAGALLLLGGRWLHKNPLMIASFFGTVVGILVLSQGWRAAKRSGRTTGSGGFRIPGTVLAVVELLVGIRLIFAPLSASRLVLSVCGIAMILCGVCNLAACFSRRKYIPGDSRIIDADE